MQPDEIELRLIPAPGDPEPDSAEHQRALWDVGRDLQTRGAAPLFRGGVRQDDAEAAATQLGDLVVRLAPHAATASAAVAGVAGAWLQARYGRKVRLKYRDAHGDVEVEARTPEEVERLVKLIPQDRAGPPKVGGEP